MRRSKPAFSVPNQTESETTTHTAGITPKKTTLAVVRIHREVRSSSVVVVTATP